MEHPGLAPGGFVLGCLKSFAHDKHENGIAHGDVVITSAYHGKLSRETCAPKCEHVNLHGIDGVSACKFKVGVPPGAPKGTPLVPDPGVS